MKDLGVFKQVMILALVSLVLGAFNNLRPQIAIDWVRDWPTYSSVLKMAEETEVPKPQTPYEAEAEVAQTEVPAISETERAEQAMSLLFSNAQITDIDLQAAVDLHQFAKAETLWVDARDAELYGEGHIEGAVLCYLYEKNTYLPELEATIAERQPNALVIYCKGADCTDSHVLAQDLFNMGHSNIFVYTGGFNEWYQAGHPIEGNLAQNEPQQTVAEGQTDQPEFDPATAESTMNLMFGNVGQMTDINLDTAHDLYRYAQAETLWVDARDPELYAEGHIEGALLCHLYEKNTYLPQLEAAIAERQPNALVIYCKGADCTDSHVLAQDLFNLGHNNIFVYTGGFNEWYQEGFPIEGSLAQQALADSAGEADAEAAAQKRRELLNIKPPGMYLEHVLRDLIPFFFGLLLIIGWRHFSTRNLWIMLASMFVGAFFVWAAWSKIENPFLFAKNIWNYDIVPGQLINISALWLPMLELVAGVGLMFGLMRKGSSTVISGLLLIFIIAISYNVLRGHEFDCGCTSTGTFFTDIYLEGWNSKYLLLMRDFGLLAMSVMGFSMAKASSKS